MSQIFTYPSFLKTHEGGYLPTNAVLIDGALRNRLTKADRRRLDRISAGLSAERLRKLKERLSARASAAVRPKSARSSKELSPTVAQAPFPSPLAGEGGRSEAEVG